MVTTQVSDSLTARRTLARVTGASGITTLVLVLGASIANDYQSVPFTSESTQIVAFFRSIDDALGAASSFVTSVGLIALLWFALGVA